MTWSNRIVWQEGMFLRAQHFQQQDRWLDGQMHGRVAHLRPHPWGVVECAINRDLLATGRFAVASAAGVLEDGTPFAIPHDTDHPPPLELPETARNVVVYLAAPVRQPGAVEVASGSNGEQSAARYGIAEFEAYDTHSGSPTPAPLQIGRLKLRYMLESDDRSGYVCLGLARVVEVGADKRVTLDDRYIPPALDCAAALPLAGFITELAGMLNQRAEALAARLAQPGARGVAEITDFLMLQTLNSAQPLLLHWANGAGVHPETLYAALVQMAGEFATFTDASRRPSQYPAYRHDDLQRSFAPVIADLRRSLSAVIDQAAVAIPLQERRYGVRVGPITDRGILRASQFVLIVHADMPGENLRRLFPSQVKIGAVEQIRELVNVAVPGIAVRPLPTAPRQIPFHAGAAYFELDRGSPHWQQMQSSGGFGIHVSGEFPNLRMELWAIRGTT
jgi:type VI secretion system protein ImpJ